MNGLDGKYYDMIVSASEDRSIKIWLKNGGYDALSYDLGQTITLSGPVLRDSISLNGFPGIIVAGEKDQGFSVYERKIENSRINYLGNEIIDGPEKNESKSQLKFVSEDQKILVSSDGRRRLEIRLRNNSGASNSPSYRIHQTITTHLKDEIYSVSMTLNKDLIACGLQNGEIVVFKKQKGDGSTSFHYSHLQTLRKGDLSSAEPITSIAITPEGEMIAAASEDKTVTTWLRGQIGEDRTKYSLHQVLKGHTDKVSSILLSPDQAILISASDDKTIKVWSKDKNQKSGSFKYTLTQTLEEHTSSILSLSMTRGGSVLASSSIDSQTRIWLKRKEGSSINFILDQVLPGKDFYHTLSFSPDGTKLFGGSLGFIGVYNRVGHKYYLSSQINGLELGDKGDVENIFKIVSFEEFLYGSTDDEVFVVKTSFKDQFFGSLISDYDYSSRFAIAMSKESTIQTLKQILDNTPRLEGQEESIYEDLHKLHHGVNPLYWFCLFESPALLRKALDKWGYEQWVYDQSEAFDPFLYSMRTENQELKEVWARYFLEEANEARLSLSTREHLKLTLGSSSPLVQELGLSKFKGKSSVNLDVEPIQLSAFDKTRAYPHDQSLNFFVDKKTKIKLKEDMKEDEEGVNVLHESTKFALSKNISKIYWFVEIVSGMAPQNKVKLRPLILAMYDRYLIYFYLYAIENFIGQILLFLTIAFQYYTWYTLIPFYIIYTVMLIFELVDISNKGLSYFQSIFNLFDVILYPAGMALTTHVVIEGYEFLEDELNNFFVVILLYLALLRGVSMLRVVSSTRYLILMILKAYIDMTPFLVVLFVFVLGTGSIYILINETNKKDGQDQSFTVKALVRASDVMYNWGHGNWDSTDTMNDLTFSWYIHTGVFIGLVMFNLLIAIINGTYTEFEDNRELIDLEDILEMISEMSAFTHFLRVLRQVVLGPEKDVEVYHHFLVPNESDKDKIEMLDNKICNLEESLKEVKEIQIRNERQGQENQKETQRNLRELHQKMDKLLKHQGSN